MIRNIILLVFILILTACGANTKSELMATAKLHAEYSVNDNYQSVYKRILEKITECSGVEFVRWNIYTELAEAEIYMLGAYSSGYLFLAEIKKGEGDISDLRVYSKFSTSRPMELIRMGAYGEQGCP